MELFTQMEEMLKHPAKRRECLQTSGFIPGKSAGKPSRQLDKPFAHQDNP